MQSVVKLIVLWMCLCIRQMVWISQGSQLGLVLPDKTTDDLFGNMGRVRIGKFTVNGDTAELDVILEDTIGAKELWLLDFQPYRYKKVTPVDPETGNLWSGRTGQCSSVEEDLGWDEHYFEDDFYQTRNSSGTKNLFQEYIRGAENATSGIRIDDIHYAGDLATFMYCERSDNINIWDISIHFEEIQYTTVLYATNIRPVPDWSPEGALHVPAVAYVQTHIKLVWRLARIAMVNFVVSSVPIVSERLLEEIGRLLVLFDFAIVEPILLDDGTPDLSRAHLSMGFTTQLPSRNRSMVVFKNGTVSYEPEVQGNSLEKVTSVPPSRLEDTPVCDLRWPKYCRQYWEFEMVLRIDISSLVEELPLDATGVFQFNFDSYKCLDLEVTTGCELASDLPPWEVRIDLTLQTTVDAVDEDTDSISISIVKLANDNGEDLRGGQAVRHRENVTVEVSFSPAFLRSSYVLELQLFMVCIGDQHMDSTRGCLGASEDKRYSAFVGDDLSFTYDPADEPEYLAMLQTTAAPQTDKLHDHLSASVPPPTVLQSYTVGKVVTQEYSIWTGVVADSVFIRPSDSSLASSLGEPSLSLHFLLKDSDDDDLSLLYVIERSPTSESPSFQPTIIADSHAFHHYFSPQPDQWHVLETILARTQDVHDSGDEPRMIYSTFTSEPDTLSYVGLQNPVTLSCDSFDTERHFRFEYEPNWVELPFQACQFLTELVNLRQLVYEKVAGSPNTSLDVPSLFDQSPELAASKSFSQERDRLLDALHLDFGFFDGLLGLGESSRWGGVDKLLYTALLFQPEGVIFAFVPSGFLVDLQNSVQVSADNVDSFSAFIIESVKQGDDKQQVDLIQTLQTVSGHTKKAPQSSESQFPSWSDSWSSVSSDGYDYWQTLDIDESFYHFLWNISALGTGHYEGSVYTTKSRDPSIILEPSICGSSHYLAGYKEHCQIDWVEVIPFWVYMSPLVVMQEALLGGWGFWSDWGSCSQSCGGGVRSRHRECVDTETGCDGQSSQTDSCNQMDCGRFSKDDFLLVFKAARASGTNIYDFWASSSYTPDSEAYSRLFKSSLVEEWADTISVEEVKVALLVKGQPVLELIFDGRDSNKMNWFSDDRLISSPYDDIGGSRKNYFSIKGHGYLGRRFFMSHWYKGCRWQSGWMVVLDGGTHPRPCGWEKLKAYPAYFYSKDQTMTNFNRGQVGIAQEFAIYIKYKDTVYIPPPPTLPPPILYTSDIISPPPPGSELLIEEYDMEKNVHRSRLPNTVLSEERNSYTMTTIYSLVSVDDERTKRDGHRSKRTLITSTRLPQLRSAQFVSEGCPTGSEFNPIDLSCECLMTDWFYSKESFQCEPGIHPVQDVDVIENNVTTTKDHAPSGPSVSKCLTLIIPIIHLVLYNLTLH